ncbi:MAG: DUF1800 family protein, partial [Opitutaceae bacterium]|nr:DUF1800 family protein [Opitutaceae bacterium]
MNRSLVSLVCTLFGFASLTVATHAQEPRLANLSTRAQVGTSANQLFTGFVIGAGANKTVLIRAVGPTLASSPFNIAGTLADPYITLYNSANIPIAANDNWGTPLNGATAVTAATFSSVGAFALTSATSRDAAIVATLPPGSYSAAVSGVGNTSGLAIIEVYELGATAGSTRLTNISSRALVGINAAVMIPLLIRAAGPALTALGVPGALADPTLTLTNPADTITYASNNDWGTPTGATAASAATLSAAFAGFTGFPFPSGSKDAAILVDLAPGSYTVKTSGTNNSTGVALVEVYDLTPDTPPTITIAATKSTSDESGSNPGEFTITRTGSLILPLTVNYSVGGSAINGYDYPFLAGSVEIPASASSVKVPLSPNPDVQVEGLDTVVLSLTSGAGYSVGIANSATVSIADSPATLYIAGVRPTGSSISGTAASGTASILLSTSGTLAAVNVTFSNLSSPITNAYLVLGPNEDFVFSLGTSGQISGAQWSFTPTGLYSSAQLLDALKSGKISVRIDTAKYPTGEVKGTFIQGAGTRTFVAPDAPPAVSLTAVTASDAARVLTQATFGPTKTEIDSLTGGSIDAWITAQMALPFTSHRTATIADRNTYGGSQSFSNWNAIHLPNRQSAWFKTVLTAPDQLRQRVAYALSQILVVSDISLGEDSHTEPLALYYDMLGNGAFGNFRTLLENVTLSPMMGMYLSALRNSKADPVTGQTPDENYAREIMQLFTIGLSQLNPDGTLVLSSSGLPIATYDQTTITELAKVFTGWSYASTTNFRTGGGYGTSLVTPMILFSAYHDDTVKNLSPVTTTVIPAAQGGVKDLQLALDALFNHANTPPFISKLLIQRLVTSNPSPGYVYRVAQKFINNGSGTRGDLGAVVRAILTDYEARSPAVVSNVTYGKLKEPLLRLTGLMRPFGASSTSGRLMGYWIGVNGVPIDGNTPKPATAAEISTNYTAISIWNTLGSIGQAALRSTTVFNFYHPDYVLPGPLAAAGLVAPEFEITDDNFAISVPNYLRTFVNSVTGSVVANQPYVITLNTTYEQTLVANPAALLDHLNSVLCAGTLPSAARTRILTALSSLATSTTNEDRAKTAILLVLTSPAAAIH